MTVGRVFNVQRFSVHDGPGIRTTVFLKGCPARCLWCHNPESQSFAPETLFVEARCAACGACARVCPVGGARPGDGRCEGCGRCAAVCPTGARQVAGRDVAAADLVAEVLRDEPFFAESGGGLTVSGGEPLAQLPFLLELLAAARAARLDVAVDTCGFGSQDGLIAAARLARLFLFDLKTVDPAKHEAFVGLPLAPILANLRALGAAGGAIWLRMPIVPGFTDDPADVAKAAEIAAATPGVREVCLLPYHATAAGKLRRLGRRDPLPPTAPPAPEALEALADLFRARGLAARVGG